MFKSRRHETDSLLYFTNYDYLLVVVVVLLVGRGRRPTSIVQTNLGRSTHGSTRATIACRTKDEEVWTDIGGS